MSSAVVEESPEKSKLSTANKRKLFLRRQSTRVINKERFIEANKARSKSLTGSEKILTMEKLNEDDY